MLGDVYKRQTTTSSVTSKATLKQSLSATVTTKTLTLSAEKCGSTCATPVNSVQTEPSQTTLKTSGKFNNISNPSGAGKSAPDFFIISLFPIASFLEN